MEGGRERSTTDGARARGTFYSIFCKSCAVVFVSGDYAPVAILFPRCKLRLCKSIPIPNPLFKGIYGDSGWSCIFPGSASNSTKSPDRQCTRGDFPEFDTKLFLSVASSFPQG